MVIIKLYELFGVDTLRHRDSARKIAEMVSSEPKSSQVTIDFDKIDFASRSFLHELICDLNDRKVKFVNRNDELLQMMKIILNSVTSDSRTNA